ncbi:MAG: glycoside hydrolase family 9 protein [Planctomycetota bacterium]|nr:glycoside hydrolase family 9 protein [Planctomycetota bacterium]
MKTYKAASVLTIVLISASHCFAGHPDHRLGLRWAEQVQPTRVRLLFGASFVKSIGSKAQTYRVVSATDTDFQRGIRSVKVSIESENDGPFPEGWKGRRYQRHRVTIDLPKPMKPGHRYWVQSMGVKHQPVTGGRAAHWIMPRGTEPPEDAVRNRLGLRGIEIISPNTILLTLGAGVHTPKEAGAPGQPSTVYETDFERGVPESWQAYKEVTKGLPPGNRRAVRSSHLIKWNGSMMIQDYNPGVKFRADASTGVLFFDYRLRNASALSVRLNHQGKVALYKIRKVTLDKWTRVKLKLSDFVDEKKPTKKVTGTLAVGIVQLIAFKGRGQPEFMLDNIRVISRPAAAAGNFPPPGPSRYVLRSQDDADFKDGRPAEKMGRRSRTDCYYTDGWPYSRFSKHEVFLRFDRDLKEGKTYSIDLNEGAFPITCGNAKGELRLDSRESFNPIIKVNQIGYLPDAVAKYAYTGAWMGSLGTLDLSFLAIREFEVRNAKTHEIAMRVKPKLRLKHTFDLQPDGTLAPEGAKGKETIYKHDLSYEDIHEIELTGLREEGTYYLALPGMGRSFEFRIGRNVYEEAYRTCIRGVFHQRCGMEMKEPYTRHYHPACHRNMTELTSLVHGSERNAWQMLPKSVIDETKHDLFGGHHDAGDFNPRSHLDVAQWLFMAWEMKPENYADGQNNIPESGNGIPDILDEARWALDLWVRLQDTDGGVRNGTESDGDPDMITSPEIDFKRDFAFAKDAPGSLDFAASAAQAAVIWKALKKTEDAGMFLKRAKDAYSWAKSNKAAKHPDALALAAIQLYRATGEPSFLADFHEHSVFRGNANAELYVWQKYDQQFASFYYAFCKRPVDAKFKDRILNSYKARMRLWIRMASTTGYRYMRSPYAPNTWGTGAYPGWLYTPMQAYTLLKDPQYLKWIQLTCDFSLGCHPMNTVFTTGLGQRSISGPLHSYARYSPDGPMPGIQCEGPSPQTGGKPAGGSMTSWIAAGLFPNGPWPQLHTYTDVEMAPGMNEGVVPTMTKTAIAYGFLIDR